MESHLAFLQQCQNEGLIPPGFQGINNLTPAGANNEEVNKQIQRTAMTSTKQHYELSIPKIREEVRCHYERLSRISESLRFQELEKDLGFYHK